MNDLKIIDAFCNVLFICEEPGTYEEYWFEIALKSLNDLNDYDKGWTELIEKCKKFSKGEKSDHLILEKSIKKWFLNNVDDDVIWKHSAMKSSKLAYICPGTVLEDLEVARFCVESIGISLFPGEFLKDYDFCRGALAFDVNYYHKFSEENKEKLKIKAIEWGVEI